MNRILALKGDIGTFYPGTDTARRAVYLSYGITRHYPDGSRFRLIHSVTIRMNHSYYPCINIGLLAWYADILFARADGTPNIDSCCTTLSQ